MAASSSVGKITTTRARLKGRKAWSVYSEVCPFLACLGQAGHDPAPALRGIMARTSIVRRARLRLFLLRRASFPSRRKLDFVAQRLHRRRGRAHPKNPRRLYGLHCTAVSPTAAGRGDRTRRPDDRRAHGAPPRPGINAEYFKPFGFDYNLRKSPTLEFVEYLRAAYGETQPFSFQGEVHRTDSALLAVQPVQK